MKNVVIVGAAVALVLGLGACSASESATEASSEYCTAVTGLQAEVSELVSLVGSDATVDELRAQREAVRSAAETVDDQAVDVSDAVDAALDSAQADYEDAIEAIPGNATASEAGQAVSAAATAYSQAVADVLRDLGC